MLHQVARRAAVALIVFSSSALMGAANVSATTVNWPQSYYDAGRTSYNPKETTLSSSNIATVTALWGQNVPGGVTGFALDSGVVYAQGQGSGVAVLSALDAASGTILWTVTTGNDGYFQSTVAAGQGLVFAGCAFPSEDNAGGVCAFHHTNGKLAWSYINDCHALPESGVGAAPAYANGTIYFGDSGCPSHTDPYVIALDAKSGQPLWSYDPGAHNLGSNLAVGGGYVYFDCEGNNNFEGVCALQQSSGTFIWSYETGDPNGALTVDKGVVYASVASGSTQDVTALNGATGAQLWTFPYPGGNNSSRPVAVAKGNVYLSGTDGNLYALRASTGTLKWMTSPSCSIYSAPSVANGVIYVEQNGGNGCSPTSAFRASNGKLLWTSTFNNSTLDAPPIIANGVLYTTHASCNGYDALCAYGLPPLRTRSLPGRPIRR